MNKHKRTMILACVLLTTLSIVACGQLKEDESIDESATSQQENNVQTVENTDLEIKEEEIVNAEESSVNQQESNVQAVENINSEIKENETASAEISSINQQECSIMVIFDRYEDDMIVVKDADDEDISMYFYYKDAEVIEGGTPIVQGDMIELTYRGVQGDGTGEHPGNAIKILAESMIYK